MEGAGCVGGQEKEWMGCFLDDLRAFASTPTSGRLQPRTRGNDVMAKWIASEKTKAGVVCPNVTERTKERIAQSKRARAGSLALVD